MSVYLKSHHSVVALGVSVAAMLGCSGTPATNTCNGTSVSGAGVSNVCVGGGPATGGASAAGETGTGGTGGTVTTGGIGTAGGRVGGTGGAGGNGSVECQKASDCELQTDCCTCKSAPVGSPFVACGAVCVTDWCSKQGVAPADVACIAGQCVFRQSCDDKIVTCGGTAPACLSGSRPVINVAGTCYTGGCLPIEDCGAVSSCSVCYSMSTAYTCVTTTDAGNTTYHCVP
jgi:hypothetical protein